MTRIPQRLLLAALLATSGAVALAQTPPSAPTDNMSARPGFGNRGGHMDPAQMQQFRAERHDRRMAYLREQLKITPAQESAWNTFAAAMQPPARAQMPGPEFDQLTAPERMDMMQKLRAERDAQMQQRSDAIKTFYAQLTPEQQQTFDAEMSSLASRRGGGRGKFGPQR